MACAMHPSLTHAKLTEYQRVPCQQIFGVTCSRIIGVGCSGSSLFFFSSSEVHHTSSTGMLRRTRSYPAQFDTTHFPRPCTGKCKIAPTGQCVARSYFSAIGGHWFIGWRVESSSFKFGVARNSYTRVLKQICGSYYSIRSKTISGKRQISIFVGLERNALVTLHLSSPELSLSHPHGRNLIKEDYYNRLHSMHS
ncbi:hypothetical protein EI94DRAFT_883855 [Lactarius quietus]|nr:hypothetical protein EI94DRAFT_883855 [Lactarius quietus]